MCGLSIPIWNTATLTEFSYYNVDNYDAKGLKRSFIVAECTCLQLCALDLS